MSKISGVKGMNDILPGQVEVWQHVEKTARAIFGRFGYGEVRTPTVEDTALFVRSVGEAFLHVFPRIVRRRVDEPWTEADHATLTAYRGRYVEFNLVYDRGTLFGLKTGGNVDAILMSLPPVATWG